MTIMSPIPQGLRGAAKAVLFLVVTFFLPLLLRSSNAGSAPKHHPPSPRGRLRRRGLAGRRVEADEARESKGGEEGVAVKVSQEIATLRSGSCSAVPYGSLDLETHRALEDLPLNELLIQINKPPFVTPPNPDGPTVVDIGLYVYELADINPADNTYLLEAFFDLTWCDPRLRFNATTLGASGGATVERVYLEKDAEKELERIWWPAPFFVNEVSPRRIENEELLIYPDGTVEYREKFGVSLSTNYDMRRFPFDDQTLLAEVESFAWSGDKLQFHIEEDIVGFSDDFEVPEFSVTGISEYLGERREVRDRRPFSELMVEVYVTRDPVFYVTKVILPLTLIVIISWSVFWMESRELADRMAI